MKLVPDPPPPAADQAHESRLRYATVDEALADAQRVLEDLQDLGSHELLVSGEAIDFTVRRALTLIAASRVAVFDADRRWSS